MVRRLQGRPAPLIRGSYRSVLSGIMAQNNIAPSQQRPDHVVRANASFTQVVQNTEYYCCRDNSEPPYRYRRYREILGCIRPSGNREAHIDIGCGAGLFSWAFLDWARENNVAFDHVELYGLDHSTQMIRLAGQVRVGLARYITDYPPLHYTHDADTLLHELTNRHRAGKDYTITFGHVLVQSHTPNAIRSFTRVIAHVIGLLDAGSNCAVIAVDARNWPNEFAAGWNALLDSLRRAGIRCELANVPVTAVNDPGRAKMAWLNPPNTPRNFVEDVDDLPF